MVVIIETKGLSKGMFCFTYLDLSCCWSFLRSHKSLIMQTMSDPIQQ